MILQMRLTIVRQLYLNKFMQKKSEFINHLYQERIMKGDNVPPEATCGYCTQGKHNECRGYECACSKNGHPT
jgi:hypothetical protein